MKNLALLAALIGTLVPAAASAQDALATSAAASGAFINSKVDASPRQACANCSGHGFTGIAYDSQNASRDQLRLFYTFPCYRRTDDRPGTLSNGVARDHEGFDAQLFGGIVTGADVFGTILPSQGDGFVERDDATQHAGIRTRDRRPFTPGSRVYRPPKVGQFDRELEAIHQTGAARNTASVTRLDDVPVAP